MSDGFSPSDAMKKEALKGLAWRKEFNRGGTMVGVARARDIANGANLSLDTVKRMNSFFARHEVDKKAEGFRPGEKGFPSNGRIAWALWGGDAGKAWASSQLDLVQSTSFVFPEDEEFLAHFGVKGMKWGVITKKDSPKPKLSKQQKRNAKASVYKKKASEYDAAIKQNTKTISDLQAKKDASKSAFERARLNKQQKNLSESSKILSEKKSQALVDAELKKQGKLSTKEKKVAKGAAITAGVLATYGAYKTVQSGEATRSIAKGRALLTGKDGILLQTKPGLSRRMTADEIMSEVVPQINPGYGAPGTKVNCRRATYAYELRRRGYDVRATRTTNGAGQNFSGVFNARSQSTKDYVGPSAPRTFTRIIKENLYKALGIRSETPFTDAAIKVQKGAGIEKSIGIDVFKELSDQPPGARGEIGLKWMVGGGHSVAWEKIGDAVHVFDTQSGKTWTDIDSMLADYPMPKLDGTTFQRLDNVVLNTDFLLRWVTNA